MYRGVKVKLLAFGMALGGNKSLVVNPGGFTTEERVPCINLIRNWLDHH
jgi:hypothetical protein